MTHAMGEDLNRILNELRQQESTLHEMQRQVSEQTTSVSTRDHAITVTVDGRGEVIALTFNNSRYRRMSPAELGDAIVTVIADARRDAAERAVEVYAPMLPEGVALPGQVDGPLDVSRMFADTMAELGLAEYLDGPDPDRRG
jgi:DNA-binding protein YbaB